MRKVLSIKASQKWQYIGTFGLVTDCLADIEAGRMPASSLLCMDLEFNPLNHKVYEIAICELTTGTVLMDVRVKLDAKAPKQYSRNFQTALLPFKFIKGNEQNPQTHHTGQIINAAQVAQLLSRFMEPETIILTWHTAATDLRILRRFLAANEQDTEGIIPDDDHYIFMIPYFKQNLGILPNGRRFPCNLPILFPLFFPQHRLIGQNHRALPDTMQLRLLTLAFLELTKPVDNRADVWRPPSALLAAQRYIKDYFQSTSIPESSLNDDNDSDNVNLASYAEDNVDIYGSEEDNSFHEAENERCSLDDENGIAENFLSENAKTLNKRAGGTQTASQKDDTQSFIARFSISSILQLGSKSVSGLSTTSRSSEGKGKKTRQPSRKYKTQTLSTNQPTRKRKAQALSANQSALTSFFSKVADPPVGQKEHNDLAPHASESLIGLQASRASRKAHTTCDTTRQ
jgi:hypothetical protein